MLDWANTGALCLGQAAASFSRSELRWEFANTAAAVVLLSFTLAAMVLFGVRRATRDPTLIYFALFCLLYAVRLLASLPSFRALFNASPVLWSYLVFVISILLVFPGILFLYQVVGERHKKFLLWLFAARALFALFEISAAALGVSPARLGVINNMKVLATFVAAAVFMVASRLRRRPRTRLSHEIRVLVVGFLVWLAFILHTNLVGLNIFRGYNVEVPGFLVFVGCLAYVSVRRTFANEERLLAINKELEIARKLQFSILPQNVPTLQGLEIVARYVPMSAVAGDFYDFLGIDEKRVGILLADVTGHGVPAALIASMLKVAFAAQAPHAHDPAQVLGGLNRSLCGNFEAHFVTAAYVFVDLEKGLLLYSGAAHPPLMITGTGREVREIEKNGFMLGMFPEAVYSSVEIRVEPGQRCLLYTDGILEATNAAQEQFGTLRFKQFLETHREIPPARFANILLDSVAGFSGYSSARSQADDITLVVLDFQ